MEYSPNTIDLLIHQLRQIICVGDMENWHVCDEPTYHPCEFVEKVVPQLEVFEIK